MEVMNASTMLPPFAVENDERRRTLSSCAGLVEKQTFELSTKEVRTNGTAACHIYNDDKKDFLRETGTTPADTTLKSEHLSSAALDAERIKERPQETSETSQPWVTLEGVTIPEQQLGVVSPKVGKTLHQELRPVPVQAPAPGEVVVKVAWTGVCGSDVHFSLGPQKGYLAENHIAGHEGIGHIVQSQDPSQLGRPVAMRYLAAYCRACVYCLRNIPESCEAQTNFPKHHQGTFQQYVTAPFTSLMPLPSWALPPLSLSSSTEPSPAVMAVNPGWYTAALCSGAAALRAMKNLRPRVGDVVVITGVSGAIGHLTGLLARHVYGTHVIGVDFAHKRARLCEPGTKTSEVFDVFIPAPEVADDNEDASAVAACDRFQQEIAKVCGELRGPDVQPRKADGLVVTASNPDAFEKLTDYVCDGGSIICVGVPKTKVIVKIVLTDLIERGIRVQGGLMGGWDESYEMMEYIRSGKVRPLVTEIGLDKVPTCMEGFMGCQNVGKMVVRVNDTAL